MYTSPQTTLALKPRLYLVRVLHAEAVAWRSRYWPHYEKPQLFLRVAVGEEWYDTKSIEGDSPVWNEDIPLLTADLSSQISFTLQHDPSHNVAINIGTGTVMIQSIPHLNESPGAVIPVCVSRKTRSATIFVQIALMERNAVLKIAAERAREATREMNQQPFLKSYAIIESLIKKLESIKVVLVVEQLLQLHPVVNAAWVAARVLHEAIVHTIKANQATETLAQLLSDSLCFAEDASKLREKLGRVHQPITLLFKQITECCLFLGAYTSKNVIERAFQLDAQEKITLFKDAITQLVDAIHRDNNLCTMLITVRTGVEVDELYLRGCLRPEEMDTCSHEPCLPDTRVYTLDEITSWLLLDSSPNVLWLYGPAGSGKSAIARSIQENMSSLARLGAYLSFERGNTPSKVIRTLAYKLSSSSPSYKESITLALRDGKGIEAASLAQQFEMLLAQPLLKAANADATQGPVVVILDALDECGNTTSRRELLRTLQRLVELPPNYRFLITGRPQKDLYKTFMPPSKPTREPWKFRTFEVDCKSDETQNDIRSYLYKELYELLESVETTDELLSDWDQNVRKLASEVSGLFAYALTAIEAIKASDKPLATLKDYAEGRIKPGYPCELYAALETPVSSCGNGNQAHNGAGCCIHRHSI